VDYVVVPNLNDFSLYADHERAVDPTSGWRRVVAEICRAKLVVSTSLHGLVVAESYGIPARHLLSVAEPIFKYRDYYEGTGRQDVRFAHSIDEALDLGGVAAPEYDPSRMLSLFPTDFLEA
jgi:pyruvyltransferase